MKSELAAAREVTQNGRSAFVNDLGTAC